MTRLSFLIALLVPAMPATADSRLFREIRTKDTVTVVLPAGECDAKVVGRSLDQLTLKLKKKTTGCGERSSLIGLSSTSVSDIVENRRRATRYPGQSTAAFCALTAMALVGAPGAYAIGAKTGSGPATLLVLFGSAVGGAVLCRERGTHYTVFSDRLVAVQP